MRTVLLSLLLTSLCVSAAAQVEETTVRSASVAFQTTDNYPLDTCVVSGETLTKDAKVVEVEGRKVKLCCAECEPKLLKDPKPFVDKLIAAVIATQDPGYPRSRMDIPLRRCASCRKAFDADVDPVNAVTGNTLIKVCSAECATKVDRLKSRVEVWIRGALSLRAKDYTVKTCPVSGKELGDQAIWVQHGTTLVKLCSKDCLDEFNITPNAFAAKVAPPAKPDEKPAKPVEKKAAGEAGKDAGKEQGEAQRAGDAAKPPIKR